MAIEESGRWPWRICVVAGLVLSAVMVARSQVGGDQLHLLARGWLLASQGELVPYGNPTSAGGVEPGSITSLLVGLPLLVWKDHRAPVVLILLSHLAAYLLLDRVVREVLGVRGRWLFCVLYWLNPWRLYHSAFLWNPNYLFLLGALHTWSAFRLHRAPRWGPSFVHALALVVAAQLHPAALILGLVSLVLWLQGRMRPHWVGLVAGAFVGSLTLVPWLAALAVDPSLSPFGGGEGYVGRGLVRVFPVFKGVLFWLRYASLSLPDRAMSLDFPHLGGASGAAFELALAYGFRALGVVGVGLAAAANVRLWRRSWRRRTRRSVSAGRISGRRWLRAYAGWTLLATLVAFALSPTTPQSWQGVIVLHVALVPLLLWGEVLLRTTRHRAGVRATLVAHAVASLVLAVAIGFGSPLYRCGGRDGFRLVLRQDSPMLHELHIHETCTVTVGGAGAWWPEVLPEGGSVPARTLRDVPPEAKDSAAVRIPRR